MESDGSNYLQFITDAVSVLISVLEAFFVFTLIFLKLHKFALTAPMTRATRMAQRMVMGIA